MDDISDRISFLVRNSGFESLRALARASGVSHTYLSLLMSDKRGRRGIGDDKAELLAKSTGFNAEWIKTGNGPMRSEQAGTDGQPELALSSDVEGEGADAGSDQGRDPSAHLNKFSFDFGSRLEEAMRYRQVNSQYLSAMSETNVDKIKSVSKKKGRVRIDSWLFARIATVLGVSYNWLVTGDGSPDYDPTWRRLTPHGVRVHLRERLEDIKRAIEAEGALNDLLELESDDRLGSEEHQAAANRFAKLEQFYHLGLGGDLATPDVYPNRRRAFILLRPHLDERAREYMLSLEGQPHDKWDVRAWLTEAERLRGELAELDAKWGAKEGKAQRSGEQRGTSIPHGTEGE